MNEPMVLRDAIKALAATRASGDLEDFLDALDDLAVMMDEAEQGPTAEASQEMLDERARNQVEWIAQRLSGMDNPSTARHGVR